MSHILLRWTFLGLAPTCISYRCLLRKVDCMLLLILVGKVTCINFGWFLTPGLSVWAFIYCRFTIYEQCKPEWSCDGHWRCWYDKDSGRFSWGPGPPLFSDHSEARRAKKIFLGDFTELSLRAVTRNSWANLILQVIKVGRLRWHCFGRCYGWIFICYSCSKNKWQPWNKLLLWNKET